MGKLQYVDTKWHECTHRHQMLRRDFVEAHIHYVWPSSGPCCIHLACASWHLHHWALGWWKGRKALHLCNHFIKCQRRLARTHNLAESISQTIQSYSSWIFNIICAFVWVSPKIFSIRQHNTWWNSVLVSIVHTAAVVDYKRGGTNNTWLMAHTVWQSW